MYCFGKKYFWEYIFSPRPWAEPAVEETSHVVGLFLFYLFFCCLGKIQNFSNYFFIFLFLRFEMENTLQVNPRVWSSKLSFGVWCQEEMCCGFPSCNIFPVECKNSGTRSITRTDASRNKYAAVAAAGICVPPLGWGGARAERREEAAALRNQPRFWGFGAIRAATGLHLEIHKRPAEWGNPQTVCFSFASKFYILQKPTKWKNNFKVFFF